MRTKHLSAFIYVRIKGEVVPSNMFKPPVIFLLTVQRQCFFVDHFCYLCS